MVKTASDEHSSIECGGATIREKKEALPGSSASSAEQSQFGVTR
jgi:hypothetical protein